MKFIAASRNPTEPWGCLTSSEDTTQPCYLVWIFHLKEFCKHSWHLIRLKRYTAY